MTGFHFFLEIDVWSFGIVLFGILFSSVPFPLDHITGDLRELAERISKGLTDVHHRVMAVELSPECHNLIANCLTLDPISRPTFEEIAWHPWITSGNRLPPVELHQDEVDEAENFHVARSLNQRLCLGMTADKLISYVERNPFRTTAGCFNLLKQELKESPQHPGNFREVPELRREAF